MKIVLRLFLLCNSVYYLIVWNKIFTCCEMWNVYHYKHMGTPWYPLGLLSCVELHKQTPNYATILFSLGYREWLHFFPVEQGYRFSGECSHPCSIVWLPLGEWLHCGWWGWWGPELWISRALLCIQGLRHTHTHCWSNMHHFTTWIVCVCITFHLMCPRDYICINLYFYI